MFSDAAVVCSNFVKLAKRTRIHHPSNSRGLTGPFQRRIFAKDIANLPGVLNCYVNITSYNISLDARFESKRLKEKDYEEVKDLVLKHYSTELPTRKMYQIKQSYSDACLADALKVQQLLKCDVSVGIFEKTSKKLVAALLSETRDSLVVYNTEYTNTEKVSDHDSALFRLWNTMEESAPAFLKSRKIFYVLMGITDSKFHGLGLQKTMAIKSEELARKLCYQYTVSRSCVYHGQKALEDVGYIEFNRIKLSDYVDQKSGLKLFTEPNPPHTHARIYYKEVGE